jgi:hypothetical protein
MIIDYETIEEAWKKERGKVLSDIAHASNIKISMQSRSFTVINLTFTNIPSSVDVYQVKNKIINWLKKFGTARINDRGVPDTFTISLE